MEMLPSPTCTGFKFNPAFRIASATFCPTSIWLSVGNSDTNVLFGTELTPLKSSSKVLLVTTDPTVLVITKDCPSESILETPTASNPEVPTVTLPAFGNPRNSLFASTICEVNLNAVPSMAALIRTAT